MPKDHLEVLFDGMNETEWLGQESILLPDKTVYSVGNYYSFKVKGASYRGKLMQIIENDSPSQSPTSSKRQRPNSPSSPLVPTSSVLTEVRTALFSDEFEQDLITGGNGHSAGSEEVTTGGSQVEQLATMVIAHMDKINDQRMRKFQAQSERIGKVETNVSKLVSLVSRTLAVSTRVNETTKKMHSTIHRHVMLGTVDANATSVPCSSPLPVWREGSNQEPVLLTPQLSSPSTSAPPKQPFTVPMPVEATPRHIKKEAIVRRAIVHRYDPIDTSKVLIGGRDDVKLAAEQYDKVFRRPTAPLCLYSLLKELFMDENGQCDLYKYSYAGRNGKIQLSTNPLFIAAKSEVQQHFPDFEIIDYISGISSLCLNTLPKQTS